LGLTALLVVLITGVIAGCGGSGTSGSETSTKASSDPAKGTEQEQTAPSSPEQDEIRAKAVVGGPEGEGADAAAGMTCPGVDQLEADLAQPTSWALEERDRAGAIKFLHGQVIKHGYQRFCFYDSSDHNSFITLVFAGYPTDEAKRQFLDQQEEARECRQPTICVEEGRPSGMIEDPRSYLIWAIQPPLSDERPTPWSYLSELAGAANVEREGVLCELPLDLPQRLGGRTQAETETALNGLNRFMREACALPAEEEVGSGEPTPEAPEQVSSLAGTTDDEAGAEQTAIAYDKAIWEQDYQTACELTVDHYLEHLSEPCPQAMAKSFAKLDPQAMGKDLAEVEERARQFVGLLIENHSLVWNGSEWLDNPEGGREGYVEEE
jgi:hypothetical protein